MDKEILLINKMIVNAELNGADSGGSYSSNEKKLVETMNEYLQFKNLQNKYDVRMTDIDDFWRTYQFVEK